MFLPLGLDDSPVMMGKMSDRRQLKIERGEATAKLGRHSGCRDIGKKSIGVVYSSNTILEL